MPLESAADRVAMLGIDGVAVRIYPAGVPVDRVAQYDGPSEAIDTVSGNGEVIQTAPSLYMISTDLGGLAIGERVEVLEGPGAGDWVAARIQREEDGAFSRIALMDRV